MNPGSPVIEKEPLPAQNEVPNCFCCGMENPSGLRLRFYRESPGSVSTEFTPPETWTGWGRMLHGGFHGLLLDETMSWVVFGLLGERAFVTREMSVRYHRPAYVAASLRVFGYLVEDAGREIKVRGEIQDADGSVLTSAEAVIRRINRERMESMRAGDD